MYVFIRTFLYIGIEILSKCANVLSIRRFLYIGVEFFSKCANVCIYTKFSVYRCRNFQMRKCMYLYAADDACGGPLGTWGYQECVAAYVLETLMRGHSVGLINDAVIPCCASHP